MSSFYFLAGFFNPSIRPDSDKLAVLLEQWISCEGHWTESTIYQKMTIESRHRRTGSRKWLTLQELTLKYGSESVAQRIKASKEADPKCKHQIRDHPDAPGDPVSWLSFKHMQQKMVALIISECHAFNLQLLFVCCNQRRSS